MESSHQSETDVVPDNSAADMNNLGGNANLAENAELENTVEHVVEDKSAAQEIVESVQNIPKISEESDNLKEIDSQEPKEIFQRSDVVTNDDSTKSVDVKNAVEETNPEPETVSQ